MPYSEHPFIKLPDSKKKIWRYMSLEKLLLLLTSEKLYFTPPTKFDDPLEGTATIADRDYYKNLGKKISEDMTYHYEKSKPFFGINCWHCNDEENLSMWNCYIKERKGIVVESDIDSLKLALENTPQDIYIGKVHYLDHFETHEKTAGLEFAKYLIKNRSFSYENEMRAIIWLPKSKDGRFDYDSEPDEEEYLIPVCLQTLIKTIRVAPNTKENVYLAIKATIEKFTPSISVIQSELTKKPLQIT